MRTLTVDDTLKLHSFNTAVAPCFAVSPDGTKLAFSINRPPISAKRFCVPFISGIECGRVGIIDLKTGALDWINAPDGIGLSHPHWSPKGGRIAVIGSDGSFLRPFTIDLASKGCIERAQQDLAISKGKDPFYWISEIELVCDLLPSGERSTRVDISFRGAQIARNVWPEAWAGERATASSLRSSKEPRAIDETAALSVIDLISGEVHSPPEEETLTRALPEIEKHRQRKIPNEVETVDERIPVGSVTHTLRTDKEFAIHVSRDNDGTRIFKSDKQSITLLHETDRHLKDVVVGPNFTLPADAACDKERLLRCILPPGWRMGDTPPPAVMWVYPGESVPSEPYVMDRPNSPGFFNFQLLAAQGYTVMYPAIPYDMESEEPSDISAITVEAVTSALAAGRDSGYFDPEHVHVFGQSNGGWAAQMLLAMTDFFRSGISMAGPSNLISYTGQFDTRMRYDDRLLKEALGNSDAMEKQLGLPGPLWKYSDAYIRQSPIFSADKIDAPLLLFHGDQDYISITHSEEMFTALRRLGKEVEFVRYWGEDHVYSSPANIRDAWQRIFDWLQEHSPVSPPKIT